MNHEDVFNFDTLCFDIEDTAATDDSAFDGWDEDLSASSTVKRIPSTEEIVTTAEGTGIGTGNGNGTGDRDRDRDRDKNTFVTFTSAPITSSPSSPIPYIPSTLPPVSPLPLPLPISSVTSSNTIEEIAVCELSTDDNHIAATDSNDDDNKLISISEIIAADGDRTFSRESKSAVMSNAEIRRRMYYLQLRRFIRRMEFRQEEVKQNILVNKVNINTVITEQQQQLSVSTSHQSSNGSPATSNFSISYSSRGIVGQSNNLKELAGLESFEVAVYEALEMLNFRRHCLFGIEFEGMSDEEILPKDVNRRCPVCISPRVVEKEELIFNESNYRRAKLCKEFTSGPSYIGACVVELAKASAAEAKATRNYASFIMEEALKDAKKSTAIQHFNTSNGGTDATSAVAAPYTEDRKTGSSTKTRDSTSSSVATMPASHGPPLKEHDEMFHAWWERLSMSAVVFHMCKQQLQDVTDAGDEYHIRTKWRWNLSRVRAMAEAEKKAILAAWPAMINSNHR